MSRLPEGLAASCNVCTVIGTTFISMCDMKGTGNYRNVRLTRLQLPWDPLLAKTSACHLAGLSLSEMIAFAGVQKILLSPIAVAM